MARLQLSLMGALQVALDGQAVTGFRFGKVRALLAYLAVQPEHAHSRDALTGLLWPEQPEEVARTNLRQALSNLRRTIHDASAVPPFLLISREAVQFNQASDSWSDVAAFTTLLDASNRHVHRRPELCTPCSQRLTEAVKLYRGPFLDGLFVHDSVAFEEWLVLQREELHRRVLKALYQLAAYHERRGAYDEAYSYAWRQIEVDPWREEAHCQAMRVLVLRGERTAALAQYETCRRYLREGLGVEPSKETTALYERIRMAEGDSDAPLTLDQLVLPSVRPHNLPPQPTPFIGRERELTELAQLIERPECRLISLVGQGGSGKTRIALEAAAEQIGAFSDGVYFVPLAPVRSSEFLASTIGAALGFTFSGQKDEQTQLLDELRDKEMLLVLDNFEHLLDAGDLRPSSFGASSLVAAILQRAQGVMILVTTRERLNLQGEWVLGVDGLPYPDAEDEGTGGREMSGTRTTNRSSEMEASLSAEKGGRSSDVLESYDAARLFVQSARRMDSSFALRVEDRPAVVRICQLVGGLPLAIELAAAWAPVLSSGDIAQEIAKNLDFLATHMRDVAERHRSMRAVFDHSWNLLSEEERNLFARLSVFRGGFRREAAEQGAGASLPMLSSLVSKSLLRRNPLGRYEIHELLRQYAYARLQDIPGASVEAQDRHASYYADFVQRREERLRGEGQLSAMEEITAEIDNVREAWRWSIERERIHGGRRTESAGPDPSATLKMTLPAKEGDGWTEMDKLMEGLWFFYEIGGLWHEGEEAFGRAAAALSSGAGTEEALSKERAIVLGKALARRAAIVGTRLGGTSEGRDLLERSVALLSRFGVRREIAFSLNMLGTVARLQSEYGQARGFLQESLALFRKAGERWGTAYSLSDLGNVAYLLGEYDQAKQLHEESLLISRQVGDRRAMMYCLNDMASVAVALGEYASAKRFCQEAIAISEEIGHRWGYASALYQMGSIALHTGDYSQAQSLLQESLAAFRETGGRQHTTLPLHQLGYLAYLEGDYPLAQRLLQEALVLCREIADRRGSAAALNSLGRVAHSVCEDQAARSYLREALGIALEIQAWPLVLDILVSMVAAHARDGQHEGTEGTYEILSLARDHPASDKQTKDRAQSLLVMFEEAPVSNRNSVSGGIGQIRTLEQIAVHMAKNAG
jgi:predicted ATPase/DNA-binding SARP family transcriptional activator